MVTCLTRAEHTPLSLHWRADVSYALFLQSFTRFFRDESRFFFPELRSLNLHVLLMFVLKIFSKAQTHVFIVIVNPS